MRAKKRKYACGWQIMSSDKGLVCFESAASNFIFPCPNVGSEKECEYFKPEEESKP